LRISNLEKELERRSVDEKTNLKRQTKAFLEKEKALETRLQNANENTWTYLDELMKKVRLTTTVSKCDMEGVPSLY